MLLIISFASSSSVNFDCPSEVEINEEFSCSLEINEGEGVYDVKVEIEEDGHSVARIFKLEEDKFISTYYYLKEFIDVGEKKEILLKVEEGGDFDMILKLCWLFSARILDIFHMVYRQVVFQCCIFQMVYHYVIFRYFIQ